MAFDPMDLDYGGPFTLRHAHQFVSNAPLGEQTTFRRGHVEDLIKALDYPSSTVFEATVFCHSLWYFPSQESVRSTFKTLGDASMPVIYVADYSIGSLSNPEQKAHQLAAEVQKLFYALKGPDSTEKPSANVRAAPDSKFIMDAARSAGYEVSRQGIITPDSDYYEGQIEVRHVLSSRFIERVKAENLTVAEEAEVLSYVPLVQKEMDVLEEKGIKHACCVDVWWAELRLANK